MKKYLTSIYSQLLLLSISFSIIFYHTFVQMVKQWSQDDNYSHGFLVPFIAGYMIWQKREELALHISTLPDMKDFYWTRLDLYNEKDMERIKDVIAQQE